MHPEKENTNKSDEITVSQNESGTNTTSGSDLEKIAPSEFPIASTEQADSSPATQDLPISCENPTQSEASDKLSGKEGQSPATTAPEAQRVGQTPVRKATGPRTAQGKARSKLNALKHGLLTKVLLLKGESRAEYLSLLNGLRDDFPPQCTLEDVEIENLAVLLWRRRRLLQAETAAISEDISFVVVDSLVESYAKTWGVPRAASGELLKDISNPYIARSIKEIFVSLREIVTSKGLTEGIPLVKRLCEGGILQTFSTIYATAERLAKSADTSKAAYYRTRIIEIIDVEIERATKLEKTLIANDEQREKYKLSAAVILRPEVSDHLLRYATFFSREIDRVLSRIERLRRMRNGQPLPPSET